jgi:hypothetical protein
MAGFAATRQSTRHPQLARPDAALGGVIEIHDARRNARYLSALALYRELLDDLGEYVAEPTRRALDGVGLQLVLAFHQRCKGVVGRYRQIIQLVPSPHCQLRQLPAAGRVQHQPRMMLNALR